MGTPIRTNDPGRHWVHVMVNLISDTISSIKSGGSTTDGATSGSGEGSTDSAYADVEIISDSSSTVFANDSVEDSDEDMGDEAPAEGTEKVGDGSAASKAASASKTGKTPGSDPNKETITVSDDQGRRKIEIDYTDRAAIKKAHEMAAAARKWQVERDRERTGKSQLEEKLNSTSRVVEALEKAYAEKGELGVIDLIAGKPGASAEFIQRQVDRAKFLEKASPEDIKRLEERERLEFVERELVKQRKENEDREARVAQEREAAELRATEATVHPVFEKHRFDGKLGDEETEAMFDEMLWTSALKRLKPYEDKGLPMTKELVDREFRTVATALRKRIGAQAEKRAASVVEQKKQEATENAQASTMSAYKRGGVTAEANDLISKGDFRSLFSNWGKYGGKVRK